MPQDAPTFAAAFDIVNILCLQKEYSATIPLTVALGPGVHGIQSSWTSSSSGTLYAHTLSFPFDNISLVGAGSDKTTLRGGLVVENKNGLQFKNMNVTSPTGMGLYVKGFSARCLAEDCTFTHCNISGLFVSEGGQLEAKRCEVAWSVKCGVFVMGAGTTCQMTDCAFHHNSEEGLLAYFEGSVDLYGANTVSYANSKHGLSACEMGRINIHLPESHRTLHDNEGKDKEDLDELLSDVGGSIHNVC